MVLVGFTEGDNQEKIEYLAKKIVNLRIFPDDDNVMNNFVENLFNIIKKNSDIPIKTIRKLYKKIGK